MQVEADLRATEDRIRGDAEQLEAAFLNLLLNGLEAVEDGGRIRVTTESQPGEQAVGAKITVRVSDDGPGVPAEARDRVFRPFYSAKQEGSGFGLPLALRTVEEHGGRLHLEEESSPLGGATFSVELPLLPEGEGK